MQSESGFLRKGRAYCRILSSLLAGLLLFGRFTAEDWRGFLAQQACLAFSGTGCPFAFLASSTVASLGIVGLPSSVGSCRGLPSLAVASAFDWDASGGEAAEEPIVAATDSTFNNEFNSECSQL